MNKLFRKFLICVALIGFSFGITNAIPKDTITPKLTKISKLGGITKMPAIQSISQTSKTFSIVPMATISSTGSIYSINSFSTMNSFNNVAYSVYGIQPVISFNSFNNYNIAYGIPSISSYYAIENPYSIESILYSGISKSFDKEQATLNDINDNYNFEKKVLDITGIFYGQIEKYIPRQSFEWDLLQRAKQDEAEFGLTKQVQEDYLYIYESVIDDMKRNYNINPDIKIYIKNQK
mgnify:CR=1 FL=1